MIQVDIENNFAAWRAAARPLINEGVPPDKVIWNASGQGSLFQAVGVIASRKADVVVPPQFIKLAEAVACYDDEQKWSLMYRLLFRLVYETPHLLSLESVADVRRARTMEKAVNRDVHKFHAFVRFREIKGAGEEIYGAWHEPQHFTVERATPFFTRRFGSMKFSIFTPKGCAHWDRERLTFSEAGSKSVAPDGDDFESMWLLYYRSIFNPFRLKIAAMKREYPARHWHTLPEAKLIPELIRKGRDVNSDG